MTHFFDRTLLQILYNFHWVAPGAARSAQPYIGGWRRFLKDGGIRAIVNLRGVHENLSWWRQEMAACAAMDIRHYDIAFNSRVLPRAEQLENLIGFFEDAPRPILIKCSGGQDRSSFVSALYILHTQGWAAFDTAQGQFARFPYLHLPKHDQHWLRHFFLYAREKADGMPISQWAPHFSSEDFAGWLGQHGLADSYKRRKI
ncbi:MAG: hypothetical protein WCD42_00765 [Rhizomicrobium sp.]